MTRRGLMAALAATVPFLSRMVYYNGRAYTWAQATAELHRLEILAAELSGEAAAYCLTVRNALWRAMNGVLQ